MLGRHHALISFLTCFPLLLLFPDFAFASLLLIIGSLIPDVDAEQSSLKYGSVFKSKNLKIVVKSIYYAVKFLFFYPYAFILSLFGFDAFKHRKSMHSIFAGIILSLILYLLLIYFSLQNYALAFFLGFVMHLIEDASTKSGIMFFYPLKILHIKGVIKTGSLISTLLLDIYSAILLINMLAFFNITQDVFSIVEVIKEMPYLYSILSISAFFIPSVIARRFLK